MSKELHDAIMNIQCRRADDSFPDTASRLLYKEGHRDARHDAAELALAAPSAASDAPDGTVIDYGTLPPLPAEGALGWYRSSSHPEKGDQQKYSSEQMQAYGHACHALGRGAAVREYIANGVFPDAAISASQAAPKTALTDEQIMRLAGDMKQRNAGVWPGDVAFARAIEAATAPNAQLVAALQELCAMYGSTWDSVDGSLVMFADGVTRFEKAHATARAALAAAGVAPLPQDKEN